MLEGLWLRLMIGGEEINREKANDAAFEYLATVFPRHFPLGGRGRAEPRTTVV